MDANTPILPPNPYRLTPVRGLDELAARAPERKAIRYYLNLTRNGAGSHLALVGQRGVGKTSLLNAAETIARDLKLLPVRIDMNEQKARSPGRFWHDLYQSLILSMVRANCWGGPQGPIYAELLRMLHSRIPGDLEKSVVQVPFIFSCHQGSIDTFECPDSLVTADFCTCLDELRKGGLAGIAFLIDEADCIGGNVPLLQMLRNVFQRVERCSLVLAGTEAVFPALSEVFSPIPRQFHKLKVQPFARWQDTLDLTLRPLPDDLRGRVAPTLETTVELHELCGGAPDELQLYCHHMYRGIEDGTSDRMNLSPRVFREVLSAYRSSSSSSDVDAVLNSIEHLPDTLLFESKWLSRQKISREENIRVSTLERELTEGRVLDGEGRESVAATITAGYRSLFESGITTSPDHIQLKGAPLTTGFWKSYVEVEKRKRWSWNNRTFNENLRQPILIALRKSLNAAGPIDIHNEDSARVALNCLRSGMSVKDVDDGMGELISTSLLALRSKANFAVDVTFKWKSPAGRQDHYVRFVEKSESEITRDGIGSWLIATEPTLRSNEIEIELASFERWVLPSTSELHRLGYISGYELPSVFGPGLMSQAITLFEKNDVGGCQLAFERILADKESPMVRNNLAFCQIFNGQVLDGLASAEKAVAGEYDPLYELNLGIAKVLNSNDADGRTHMSNALEQVRKSRHKYSYHALFGLVLQADRKSVRAVQNVLLEAAIIANIIRMQHEPDADVERALGGVPPETRDEVLRALREA